MKNGCDILPSNDDIDSHNYANKDFFTIKEKVSSLLNSNPNCNADQIIELLYDLKHDMFGDTAPIRKKFPSD
tara:strand:- start:2204 stop:2419 length:216 start_codon:yes stop_codon:yes gene_type:complete